VVYTIKKGRDIKLKGAAQKQIKDISLPKTVAIQPPDFKGLKPRLVAKLDDIVKVGSTVIIDKVNEAIKILSPVSGKVVAVNRGDKRALLEVVIESDGSQEKIEFAKYDQTNLKRQDVINGLIEGGLFATIRQRPFSKFAHQENVPKSIFVHATNTEPLAADADVVLEGQEDKFQKGLDLLKILTEGDVHLCVSQDAKSKALTEAKNVSIQKFAGPHPAGNVSTHIFHVDPINKGDIVWYIEAQDVVRIASLFLEGTYPTERIVAVTGDGAKDNYYAKTILGAPLSALLEGSDLEGKRCLTGSILTGRIVGKTGFVGFYDSQIMIMDEGGDRELLGWMLPGVNKHTFSKTFISSFLPEKENSLKANEFGGHRAIVLNNLYDQYVPLDIMTYFLIKAVYCGDLDEAEKLGILECDEEDFALATFACPSKFDVGAIVRDGLDKIEKEG
jgi:Na+-transporting NADH:ubiquinone oxidoreductase subunit A